MILCETEKQIRVLYSQPVAHCVRWLKLFPADRGSQRVTSLKWECVPTPQSAEESSDEFGNRILELRHPTISGEFRFAMKATSERIHANSGRDENLPPSGIGAFLLPSALCDRSLPLHEVATAELQGEARSENPQGLADAACRWTHQTIRYSAGVTDVSTTASQVLERRSGVCQDFAHLMIALCRVMALPARYVSGYNPAEGGMHAWVEVLCGAEWLAFDPTQGRAAGPECVAVAVGRDFRDVAPMSGHFKGSAEAKLQVWSSTRVVPEASAR